MSFVHMLRDLLRSCVFTKVALYRGLAASSLVISLLIVYGYAFLPLRRVPGPWLSRLFLLRDSAGRPLQGKRLLQLHQKYGQVVRVGPRRVSIQGIEFIQPIYRINTSWKKPLRARNDGFPQILSHGVLQFPPALNEIKCRQIIKPCFYKETVAKQQQVILNCADTALTVTEIACESDEGRVDVLQIARTYAFDLITEFVYGGSWQGRGTHSERKAHLNILDDAMSSCDLLKNKWTPFILKPMLNYCSHILPSKKMDRPTLKEFKKMSADSVKAFLEDYLCKPGASRGCLASLIESKDSDANQLEAADFTVLFLPILAAAIDPICATLTFALWDLARFPDFRKRAAEEVAKFFPSRDDMTVLALDDLPFLNAFLWESVRYHGVPVSSNERVAPEGGSLVSGVFLPGGVTAICDPQCQSMDPCLFSSPENFDPERWLCPEAGRLSDLTMNFSYGERSCLGQGLAETALRFAVASMLFDFDFEMCAQSDSSAIRELENDITKPWRWKLILNFTPRLQREEDFDMQDYSIIDVR